MYLLIGSVAMKQMLQRKWRHIGKAARQFVWDIIMLCQPHLFSLTWKASHRIVCSIGTSGLVPLEEPRHRKKQSQPKSNSRAIENEEHGRTEESSSEQRIGRPIKCTRPWIRWRKIRPSRASGKRMFIIEEEEINGITNPPRSSKLQEQREGCRNFRTMIHVRKEKKDRYRIRTNFRKERQRFRERTRYGVKTDKSKDIK